MQIDKQELERLEVIEAIKKLITEKELSEAVGKIVFAMEIQFKSGYQQAVNDIRNGIAEQKNKIAQNIAKNFEQGGITPNRKQRRNPKRK